MVLGSSKAQSSSSSLLPLFDVGFSFRRRRRHKRDPTESPLKVLFVWLQTVLLFSGAFCARMTPLGGGMGRYALS